MISGCLFIPSFLQLKCEATLKWKWIICTFIMMRLATALSFLVATAGIILIVICISTNYWVSRKRGLVEVNEGLWYICRKAKGSSNVDGCKRLFSSSTDIPGKLVAVIALMHLSCACHVLNAVISSIIWFVGKSPGNFSCIFQVITTSLAVAGLSTYVKYYNNRYYSLDWSYIVGWAGVSALFIGLVFMIVGIERRRSYV